MGRVLPFAGRKRPTYCGAVRRQTNGTIEIFASEVFGGGWSVWHRSSSGDSVGHVGDFFAFDQAEAAARLAAEQYGATLDMGVPSA